MTTPFVTSIHRAALILTTLATFVGAGLTARADTFTLTTAFDSTFDPILENPFVGEGILTYDAGATLADGSYDWTSFTNLTLQLTFGSTIFSQLDLTTPASQVNIEIRGGSFFFTNDNPFGVGTGQGGGSADFQNGSFTLTTQPMMADGTTQVPNSGPNNPLYFANVNGGNFNGTYGAVPEPSTWALLVAGTCMCAVLFRRTRRLSS